MPIIRPHRRRRSATELAICLLLGIPLFFLSGLDWGFAVGLTVSLWAAGRALIFTRTPTPLLELGLLLAGIQWIIAPWIAYAISFDHRKMKMYCSEDLYMSIVGPGLAAYAFGLFLFEYRTPRGSETPLDLISWRPEGRLLYVLLTVALASLAGKSVAPSAFAFPLELLALLRFPVALALYNKKGYLGKLISGAVFAQLVLSGLNSAMFNGVVLWMLMAMQFMFARYRVAPSLRIGITALAASMTLGLQVIKADYRAVLWNDRGVQASLQASSESAVGIMASNDATVTALENTLPRFNQGWIISAAIAYTPRHSPFLAGDSVFRAVEAVFMPSAFFDRKIERGSSKLVEETAGINVSHGTSMTLSTIGESYVNFGPRGAPVMMLALGAAFSLILSILKRKCKKCPPLLVAIPVVFVGMIAPGVEIYGQINAVVKGAVFLALSIPLLSGLTQKSQGRPFDAS